MPAFKKEGLEVSCASLPPNSRRGRGYRDTEKVVQYLHERGVERFVHFTDIANVISILNHGLLSREELDSREMAYFENDSLRLDGSNHINLSITHPNIPFFFVIRKRYPERYYVVLSIDIRVLFEYTGDGGSEKYSFINTNAASRCAMPCNVEQLFSGHRPLDYMDNWTTDPQAEVLIPGPIAARYINAIFLPSSCRDAKYIEAVRNIDIAISESGLPCELQVSDIVFDNLRQKVRSASPREKFEYYYLSWQSDESNYSFLESELEKIPSRSYFNSTAVPENFIEQASRYCEKASCYPEWYLEFYKPSRCGKRSNEELSSLAVIEKIINRSSIGIVSGDLEQQLQSIAFESNRQNHTEKFCFYTGFAHQLQCALVELVKCQCLRKDAKLFLNVGVPEVYASRTVAELSIGDLNALAANVCSLYKSDNPFEGISFVESIAEADFIINYSSEESQLGVNESKMSLVTYTENEYDYDAIQVQVPVAAFPTPQILKELLRYIFRFDDFREGQYPALVRALQRHDAIVLLPTGSGKSIIFQFLSLITPGTAFVVSPIVSLIDDQVQNLKAKGIDRIVGLTGRSKGKRDIERKLATGQYLICYVSPERFQIQSFINSVRNYAEENLVSVVAIDEAHCVSEWGHDFRTSYLGLARNCRSVCCTNGIAPPLLALTGTASTSVLTDMRHDLEIEAPESIIRPKTFDRRELHYRVVAVPSDSKLTALDEIMQKGLPADLGIEPERIYTHTDDAETMGGIVFCQNASGSFGLMNTQKAVEYGYPGVWDHLDSLYPGECSYYCGKQPKRFGKISDFDWAETKAKQAIRFKNNNTCIMVATKAFGMGIDKPNVRWIIHFGMPGSLESYYQEVGRAARDGEDAYAYLILSDDYPDLNDSMLNPAETDLSRLKALEETKKEFKGDDVSRCLYFHKTTFAGVDEELSVAKRVLELCSSDNYYDKRWHIPFSSSGSDSKNGLERAIYRLTLLGVFRGYTVDYHGQSAGFFIVEPVQASGEKLRNTIVENYLSYIKSYQSDSAFLSTAHRNLNRAVKNIEDDRSYILLVLRHLLDNFTYKIIEEGRRRAIMTILSVSRKAAQVKNKTESDDFFRGQIVAYLATNEDDAEMGLGSILYEATDTEKLLSVIEWVVVNENEQSILQQALRLLEDYPQHYGFYFIVSALQARAFQLKETVQSLKSMLYFGTENYGLTTDQCIENFLLFINGDFGKKVCLEMLDSILCCFASLSELSYRQLLNGVKAEKVNVIKNISRLDSILIRVEGEMKWMTMSTKK